MAGVDQNIAISRDWQNLVFDFIIPNPMGVLFEEQPCKLLSK